MGFGSYDEEEQDKQDIDASDIEMGDVDRTGHEGSVEFETEETTEELVDRLKSIKED